MIDLRAAQGERGTVASASLRYFGCVIGGSHPVALAAGLLTSAWDRSAGIHAASPLLAAVAEEVAGEWLPELFDPPRASDGCAAPPFP
ncbi:MAG: hypothetical protein ABFC67_15300 [Mizugakiibacter sp.]|uniref:hypothetical protein n=1 Tax=Mizugakiibacter sp. TaxID=1972610 RepID=UPI0031CA378E|nr:hypothetical protein [Xanthomonadaceae bacterium]